MDGLGKGMGNGKRYGLESKAKLSKANERLDRMGKGHQIGVMS